jgi:hypothetical protein
MADKDAKWGLVGTRTVRITKDAIDVTMECSVLGLEGSDFSFTAYPQISVLIDGAPVLYEPVKRQKVTI